MDSPSNSEKEFSLRDHGHGCQCFPLPAMMGIDAGGKETGIVTPETDTVKTRINTETENAEESGIEEPATDHCGRPMGGFPLEEAAFTDSEVKG